MIAEFDWCNCGAITQEQKADIETKIRDGEDHLNAKFKSCHPGPIAIQLNIIGPLLSDLVGNVKCSCGKPYVKINGEINECIFG